MKAMEDHRDNLIVILAGYREEMEHLLEINPGLRSRFSIQLDFPDYTISELLAIGQIMAQDLQYSLTSEALKELEKILRYETLCGHPYNGNARLVRNLLEKAIRRQALRPNQRRGMLTREKLMLLEKEDFLFLRVCGFCRQKYQFDRKEVEELMSIIRGKEQ